MKQAVKHIDTLSSTYFTITIEGKAEDLAPAGAAAFRAEHDAMVAAIGLLLEGKVSAKELVKQAAQDSQSAKADTSGSV